MCRVYDWLLFATSYYLLLLTINYYLLAFYQLTTRLLTNYELKCVQEMGMTVVLDNDVACVALLDGKRRVRLGHRQAAGKEKAAAF